MSSPACKKFRMALVLAAAGVLASGCAGTTDDLHHYFGHSDDVVVDAGDAVSSNKVAHTIDPWSRHSERTDIRQNSARTSIAVRRYQTDNVKKPGGDRSPTISIDVNEGNGAVTK